MSSPSTPPSWQQEPAASAAVAPIDWTDCLGLDAFKTEYDSANFRGTAPSPDLARPAHGQSVSPVRDTAVDRGSRTGTTQTGLYMQDQVNFGAHWTAVMGLRHDWSRQHQTLRRNQAMARQDNEATTWRAGLVYKFANGIAPYASYSESFHPVSAADANGEQFKPTGGVHRALRPACPPIPSSMRW